MHDVIIIGGRCAGASLALLLARAGLRPLVLERAVFPSDTMSGHYIHPAGVACLRRWGLGDLLAAAGAPAQRRITVDFGPVALSGTPAPATDGTTEAFAPRRHAFDTLLAEAASASGAAFRDGTSFLEPLVEDGRVVGVRAVGPGGREGTLRARLVIGADGNRSRRARAADVRSHLPEEGSGPGNPDEGHAIVGGSHEGEAPVAHEEPRLVGIEAVPVGVVGAGGRRVLVVARHSAKLGCCVAARGHR
jgi:2-polyprenyl-6-methoxyphenol hydroxylase-like FAD-dependent oxidoreductase